MGFCARCGDLMRGSAARCSKCGGRPLERTTASTTDTSPATDKWMSSYLQRHISKADTDDSSSLGNVAGSNLDPVSKLSKWSCSHCRQMFTPSATIYSDPDDHGSRYCQGCYRRKFQKGTCCRCYKGVFPDQKYIHMDRYYWHKTCFKCVGCLKDVSEDPLIDLDKRPCCEACFENEAGHVPSIAATPAEHPLSPENAEKLTMAELNAKLTGVSLASLPARQSSEHSRPCSPSSASATDSSDSRPNTPATPLTGALPENEDKVKEMPSLSTRTTLPPISRTYNPPPSNYLPPERPLERPHERHHERPLEYPSERPVGRTHKAYSASISIPQETMKESALYARRFNVATPASKVDSPGKDVTDVPCVKCNQVEGSKTFTPQGKVYHRECLTCAKCKGEFTNEHCFESGDQFYHNQCSPIQRRMSFATPVRKPGYNVASSIFASRVGGAPKFASNQATCPRCRRSVVFIEQTPGPMNSKWHKRCLNCYSCHKQLDSSAKVLVADQPPSPTKRWSQTPQPGYAGTSPTLSRSASVSLAVKALAPQKPVTDDEDALTRVFCRACYDAERIRLGYTTGTTLSRSASAIIRR